MAQRVPKIWPHVTDRGSARHQSFPLVLVLCVFLFRRQGFVVVLYSVVRFGVLFSVGFSVLFSVVAAAVFFVRFVVFVTVASTWTVPSN